MTFGPDAQVTFIAHLHAAERNADQDAEAVHFALSQPVRVPVAAGDRVLEGEGKGGGALQEGEEEVRRQ